MSCPIHLDGGDPCAICADRIASIVAEVRVDAIAYRKHSAAVTRSKITKAAKQRRSGKPNPPLFGVAIRNKKRPKTCSICGAAGHSRRSCRARVAA